MMYMTAQRGSTGFKVTSIVFHENLERFIRERHVEFINLCSQRPNSSYGGYDPAAYWRTLKFSDYLERTFWYIMECKEPEINQKTGKPKKPKNLAKDKGLLLTLAARCGLDTEL